MEEDIRFVICRLCLSGNNDLINIFDSKGVIEYKPADVITELLRYEVSAGDKYPQSICIECLKKLKEFKGFKERCDSCKELLDKAHAAKIFSSKVSTHKESPSQNDYCHFSGNMDVNKSLSPVDEDPLVESEVEPDELEDSKPFVERIYSTADEEVLPELTQVEPDVFEEIKPVIGNMSSVEDEDFSLDSKRDLGAQSTCEKGSDRARFQCPKCGKNFVSWKDYRLHVHQHKYGPNLKCGNCGEIFTNVADRSNHVNCTKKVKCDLCDRYYNNKYALKKHRTMHGEKEFECEECHKCFHTLDSLRTHKTMHNKVRIHACDSCGKEFQNRAILKLHKYAHEGKHPGMLRTCVECGYLAVSTSKLTEHMRKHTGEKPFACLKCGMRFTTKSSMTKHLRLQRCGVL